MEGFYNNDENFEILYKDVSMLLSDKIIESSLAESWLVNWYVCNKYNTTKALEKYTADLLIPKLKYSEIPPDKFRSIINRKLNGCYESYNDIEASLEDKLYMIEKVRDISLTESLFSYIIQDFECNEIVSYIEEGFFTDLKEKNTYKITEEFKEVVSILSHIKNTVLTHKDDLERLNYIKECNTTLLYKHKYVVNENYKSELDDKYLLLENLLELQSDVVIEYSLSELNYINNMIDYLNEKVNVTTESFIYEKAIDKFNSLVESIFFEDTEIELESFIELYEITEALCEYESTMEVSSRIITKGTEKTTKAIGNASARGAGMSSVKSNVGRVKRGARIAEDRASEAVNRKIDDIINFTRSRNREKIITGSNTIKLSRDLKTLITAAIIAILGPTAALKIGGMGLQGVKIAASTAGLLGGIKILIGIMAVKAMNKKTKESERKKILVELETELKIVKEKIEDAKGDNAREQKYQLMRIEANLEKEIMRIKHGLRYY